MIEAVPPPVAEGGGEPGEGAEETNAVLRWLQRRLTRHGAVSTPFRPEIPGSTRGTPAVEAALQQAARLAGPQPVGSHHLLLAALEDTNSAASAALASLGVDPDALREKLRAANVTGTTDEQPEQAGRRQMSIQVSDEMLTLVLTDPVIVEAGKQALKAVRAAAAATASAAEASGADDVRAETAAAQEAAAAPGAETTAEESGAASVTSTVIRGDHPAAANLAHVWLELRKTLSTLAATAPAGRQVKQARKPRPGELGEPEDPEEPGAATS
ncbi:MAG TPA: Clp protease N-terminal domain-containing protein [Trebonia sp.]|nr:Clp protease N-terminal domain-containing protein [Trebonia sp.]